MTKDMTQGTPWKLILLFSLPLMLGNLFQQLYTVVDTILVGQALGVSALAALGTVDWLYWMALSIVQGFTQGFGIMMAQRFGARDEEGLRKSVGNSFVLSCFLAVVLTAVMELLIGPLLTLLQVPEEIRYLSEDYLMVILGGLPVVMAYNLYANILRSLGDSRSPLIAMVIAALSNIGMDILFVFFLQWGVAGAAAASVLAQLLSAGYCIRKVRHLELLKLSRSDYQLDRKLAGRLWVLGIPMAFQNMVISVGGMIVQYVINGFGVVFIAGFTATNKLYGMLEVAATSYGYAMVTYAGQNLGAGQVGRIRRGVRSALLISIVTSLLISTVMLVFGRSILSLFIKETPENPSQAVQALEIAYHYLSIMSVCLPILYFLHVVRSGIQGMGNTVLPMVSGFAEFFMRTGAALLLPLAMGEEGIFYAEVLAWIGADVVLGISYLYTVKRAERLPGKNGQHEQRL